MVMTNLLPKPNAINDPCTIEAYIMWETMSLITLILCQLGPKE